MKQNVLKSFSVVAVVSLLAMLTTLSSCKDMLEEENFGNPTVEDMMTNEENVVLLVGQAYADVKWLHDHWGYWGVASLTSDECVCPVRSPGEHWADGGYWKNLNTHEYNSMADAFKNIWNSTISGAVLCNKLIQTLNDYKSSMSESTRLQYIAELEVLRSYYYYMLFDCFGRIPYNEEYAVTTASPLMEAPDVWAHLVACLEKNVVNLPQVTDGNRSSFYGRVSQGMAYTLLARLYLNAESYGCNPTNVSKVLEDSKMYDLENPPIRISDEKDFYTNVVRCCDGVINSGSYSIEENYFSNFLIANENSRENIFVIVEDGNAKFDLRYSGSMMNKLRMVHLSLHYCHQTTWSMIEKPWNGFCARPDYMKLFKGNDVRGAGVDAGADTLGTNNPHQYAWFVGPIMSADGKTLLKDENKNDAIIQVDIATDYPASQKLDSARWGDGARFWKYEVDKTKKYDWGENDFVLLRYADVLWMKEEAILRGGTGVSEFNSADFTRLKERAFAYDGNPSAAYKTAYPDVLTLDGICDERGREFSWENMRRRDLIRFGKYESVQYVTAKQPYRRWFPIPFSVIEKCERDAQGKPIWTQNEGY